MPIWEDEDTGERILVGSVAELSELAGRDLRELDLHRPYVDEICFPQPQWRRDDAARCRRSSMSGLIAALCRSRNGAFLSRNRERFAEQFPADYICEAVDQTRGWFYSLHAISSLIFGSVSFKNVICLGHILDGEGRKMSKRSRE